MEHTEEILEIVREIREDVSYMMNRVQEQGGQATFMRVLTHEAGPGHSRIFDIDEQVLPNAVKIFCGVVYDIMH